jgi:hypothetical protein
MLSLTVHAHTRTLPREPYEITEATKLNYNTKTYNKIMYINNLPCQFAYHLPQFYV